MNQLDKLSLPTACQELWNAVLYGIDTSSGEIVAVALSQVGNVGGHPYWSWYGFSYRVNWCAIFVSWCANQYGYIDAGVVPKFAGCMQGSRWFKERGLWQERGYTPNPGDIIFFDWRDPDSFLDHKTGCLTMLVLWRRQKTDGLTQWKEILVTNTASGITLLGIMKSMDTGCHTLKPACTLMRTAHPHRIRPLKGSNSTVPLAQCNSYFVGDGVVSSRSPARMPKASGMLYNTSKAA